MICAQRILQNLYPTGNAHDNTLGNSRNYIPPIPVPFCAKRIATQILVTAKLNARKDFILRVFVCDMVRPSKELPVQN